MPENSVVSSECSWNTINSEIYTQLNKISSKNKIKTHSENLKLLVNINENWNINEKVLQPKDPH